MPKHPTTEARRKRSQAGAKGLVKRVREHAVIVLITAIAGALIALSQFTTALTNIRTFLGWKTSDETMAAAKSKIHAAAGDIEHTAPPEAQRRLTVIKGVVAELNSTEAKQAAVQELVNIIFHDPSPDDRMRKVRAAVVASIMEMQGQDVSRLFNQGQLEELDFYGAKFDKAHLRGVSFKGCFLVKASFKDAELDEADFSEACLRNSDFTGASVVSANFDDADWFNAAGFTQDQLARAKIAKLMLCPKNEQEMRQYLAQTYEYQWENWGPAIQNELRRSWEVYWKPGGLAESVAAWQGQKSP
ncbi:MAG: pentapeptide repeat-containing protein [Chthoniobacterales bacterium]